MLGAWRRALMARPTAAATAGANAAAVAGRRTAVAAAASQQRRGLADAASAAAAFPRLAPDQPPLRTATSERVGAKPKILERAPTNRKQHSKDMAELRAHMASNVQSLPVVQQYLPPRVTEVKPKNKKESKLFAHLRRLRLNRQRELFPIPPRPYFPPVRVNHTPKSVHTQAHAQAAEVKPTEVANRLTALIARTAATAATTAADSTAAVESASAAPAAGSAAAESGPTTRFAIVDVNSKQHKVVPGDLLMVDRLTDVSVGDKLQFDRVLMVGSKTYTVLGRPFIPLARVMMTCEEHSFTKHMIVFKKHRRKGYRKTKGHRQHVTLLRVDSIDYDADADTTAQPITAAPDPTPSHASAPRRVKPAAKA